MIDWNAVWVAVIISIAILGLCHFFEKRDKK